MILRQVQITQGGDQQAVIEFREYSGHKYESIYYMYADAAEIATTKIIGLVTAWLGCDDANMNHHDLMISETR